MEESSSKVLFSGRVGEQCGLVHHYKGPDAVPQGIPEKPYEMCLRKRGKWEKHLSVAPTPPLANGSP